MPKWTHVSKKAGRKLSARYGPYPLEVREWALYDDWLVKYLDIFDTLAKTTRKMFWDMSDFYTYHEGGFVEFKGIFPDKTDKP